MSDYIEKVVLRLKREYSKDELVAHLSKKLTEAEMEIGMLKSEKEEALYKLNKTLKADPEVLNRLALVLRNQHKNEKIKRWKEKYQKMELDKDKLLLKVIELNKLQPTVLPRIENLRKSA